MSLRQATSTGASKNNCQMKHPWSQKYKIILHLDSQCAAEEQSLLIFTFYRAFLILMLGHSAYEQSVLLFCTGMSEIDQNFYKSTLLEKKKIGREIKKIIWGKKKRKKKICLENKC